ncbi:MAG: elongation factor P [Pirellulales bacterium]|nr:elongation factor P [Pirellulales bacterium]
MLAKEIKPGAVVNFNDAPCQIEDVNVQTPSARGAATLYKYRARNLVTRQKVDITLKGGESLDEADFARREIKYMYSDATHAHFLDQADYEQYALPLEDIQQDMQFVTEALEGMMALIYQDECVGIQIPAAVALEVTECDPLVKGDSATKRTKPATLETGFIVQVPEYLKQGEVIKVDTRSGEFISRV